jgi:hypothetical protein
MAAIKVGVREFREQIARFLESDTPVAVTRRGETLGVYVQIEPSCGLPHGVWLKLFPMWMKRNLYPNSNSSAGPAKAPLARCSSSMPTY